MKRRGTALALRFAASMSAPLRADDADDVQVPNTRQAPLPRAVIAYNQAIINRRSL